MFARRSAGAADRRRRRVPGGFPHPQAEYRAGSRPGAFRRRMLALLPQPGSSENPDPRVETVPRHRGSFRWPPRPSRKAGVAPAPRVHNNRGPEAPRAFLERAHSPLRQVCRQKQNPRTAAALARLLPSPGVVSGESRGPGLARSLTPALDQLRAPRVQQPRRPHSGRRPLPSPRGAAGPGFSRCMKSFSLQ